MSQINDKILTPIDKNTCKNQNIYLKYNNKIPTRIGSIRYILPVNLRQIIYTIISNYHNETALRNNRICWLLS